MPGMWSSDMFHAAANRRVLVLATAILVLSVQPLRAGKTFHITTPLDTHDLVPGDGLCSTADGDCSLRAALEESNARGGGDTILISSQRVWIKLSLGQLEINAPRTIVAGNPGEVRIDGIDNPFACASLRISSDSNAVSGVTFRRARGHAIVISGAYNTIGGTSVLHQNQFIDNGLDVAEAYAIVVAGEGASHNLIIGNQIGIGGNGTEVRPNANGILIGDKAHDNRVGQCGSSFSNLISGNRGNGIMITNSAHSNSVINNVVGPDVNGDDGPGNSGIGVVVERRSCGNIIGGNAPGCGNLISLNGHSGIEVSGAGTDQNIVSGNLIGVDVRGNRVMGNGEAGVLIMSGAAANIIGSTDGGGGNLISGNGRDGIRIVGAGTDGNQVAGNRIGLDSRGYGGIGNGNRGGHGVSISGGAQRNVIGSEQRHNVISGNDGAGVCVSGAGTSFNRIVGNFIGLTALADGTQGNGCGVLIDDQASDNVVGGGSRWERNVISGNDLYPFPMGAGVVITGSGSSRNRVIGNLIGTDTTGTRSGRNRSAGVVIGLGASENVIGGRDSLARNLISGNGADLPAVAFGRGISIYGDKTARNEIVGNWIGLAIDGESALPNNGHGVAIASGANRNVIGGLSAVDGNRIVSNKGHGILVTDSMSRLNCIRYNEFRNNDSLGIAIRGRAQDGIKPPTMSVISPGKITGQAARATLIDLYRSDGDPSGSGEGSAFVATIRTDVNGTFELTDLPYTHGEFVTAVATDSLGNSSEFSVNVGLDATTHAQDFSSLQPESFGLDQNFPNPFNPSTMISYTIPFSAPVELRIFNVLGEKVSTLTTGVSSAGRHSVVWDGTNDRGGQVASGVYWYQLQSGNQRATRKMLLLR